MFDEGQPSPGEFGADTGTEIVDIGRNGLDGEEQDSDDMDTETEKSDLNEAADEDEYLFSEDIDLLRGQKARLAEKEKREFLEKRKNRPADVNDKGEPIYGSPLVESEDFLQDDDQTRIDWKKFEENGYEDDKGFEESEMRQFCILTPGTRLARWGNETGSFLTDEGTEYEELSLPYREETVSYHVYEVKEPIYCEKGRVAPNFHRKGGGWQYFMPQSVVELTDGDDPRLVEVEQE